ncbi:MAG: DNA repair protein RecO [Chlamydiia bacterium]|nr:DNA repair protein RecO [Chlamydiia bacterium]MCH9615062.1 DNA repair protein RecO [Chlamydiia bacterium]MCH9629888.1 DNA repair protein RecO [Chlamydiia bacterium]
MERIEGIVLNVIPYGEKGQIVQMLSLDRGRISALLPGRLAQKVHTEPFSCSEFEMKSGRGAMYRCKDVTLLDAHLGLRESYEVMEAGGKMLKILLKTQYPDRPCEILYGSLKQFLKALPQSKNPKNYSLSFALKVLRHEGILEEEPSLPPSESAALKALVEAKGFNFLDTLTMQDATISQLRSYIKALLASY